MNAVVSPYLTILCVKDTSCSPKMIQHFKAYVRKPTPLPC